VKTGALVAGTVLVACTHTVLDDPSRPGAFPDPRSPIANVSDGVGIVTDFGSDQLSIIDLRSNLVSAQRSVVVDPIAQNGPHHAQIDSKNGWVYVTLAFPAPSIPPGPHATLTNTPGLLLKLALEDLSVQSELTVDVSPGDVKLTPDASKLLVSHFDLARVTQGMAQNLGVEQMRATIMVVDPGSLQTIVDVPLCAAPNTIDITPDGKTAYVACYAEDAVGVVHLDATDLATNPAGAVERFPVGPSPGKPGSPTYGPYTLAVVGTQLYVGERDAKSLDVIDLPSRQVVRSIPLSGAVTWIAPTAMAQQVIVSMQADDGLDLVDTFTGTVKASRSLADGSCTRPNFVAASGERYFVVCGGDSMASGGVLEIDKGTLATVRSFAVGTQPDSIAFAGGTQ
jgi:DNA-binding beta-propeller fold protein YncE